MTGPGRLPFRPRRERDPPQPQWSRGESQRRATATLVVKRGLAQAEEKYLVAPDASLGTWFARVTETLAVAARVVIERTEGDCGPGEFTAEQLGLFADICAEAIRAAAQVWGSSSSSRAREEIVELIISTPHPSASPSSIGGLWSLAGCLAAMEPLANGLRDGDLPMGEPIDCDRVAEALLGVALHAFQAIEDLC
ncbi:MAG TPA: hypothetical protein VG448_03150 [Solirubrobacterales bacterium]|nr:hypothetical protein [Solirubrobacterales bacterium]